jgi:DNA invertase Pin-like site-specific DNA recombinase
MAGTAKRQTAEATTAVYVRISKDRSSQRKGVDRQREDCEALCQRNGWQVTRVFEDNDISASKYTKRVRPGYRELMTAVEDHGVTRIVCWRIDRLYRRPKELESLIEMTEAGRLEIVSAMEGGAIDLSTSQGRMSARVHVAAAASESETTHERLIAELEQRRGNGEPSGGHAAYGWRTKTTIDPAESKVLLAAMDDVLKGRSLSDIAREWNATRVRGRDGWDANIIGKIITRPHHAGLLIHKGKVIGTGTWKQLITTAKYDRLVEEIKLRATASSRLPKRRTLLTGLLRCGECGHVMYRSSSEGVALWRCHTTGSRGEGCGKVNVRAALIEPRIIEAAIQRVDDLRFAQDLKAHQAPGRAGILARALGELEQREQEMGESFAAGKVKIGTVEAFATKTEADRKAWTDELARIEKQSTLAPYAGKRGVLRKAWAGLSMDTQRTIIAEAIGPVTIAAVSHRGQRFDPTRILFGPAPKVQTIR